MLSDIMFEGAESIDETVEGIRHYLDDTTGAYNYVGGVRALAENVASELTATRRKMEVLRIVLDTEPVTVAQVRAGGGDAADLVETAGPSSRHGPARRRGRDAGHAVGQDSATSELLR